MKFYFFFRIRAPALKIIAEEITKGTVYGATFVKGGRPVKSSLTPSTYGPIEVVSGTAWGDLEHPMQIVRRCPICNYHSAAKPQEVRLS